MPYTNSIINSTLAQARLVLDSTQAPLSRNQARRHGEAVYLFKIIVTISLIKLI